MKNTAIVARLLVRLCGIALIILGILFWTGHALSLVPFLHPRISETASGPVERYVPPVEAGP